MKVGDLVSVERKLCKPVLGLILEIYEMKGITSTMRGHALVQPCDPESRLMWASPLDVEVISESR